MPMVGVLIKVKLRGFNQQKNTLIKKKQDMKNGDYVKNNRRLAVITRECNGVYDIKYIDGMMPQVDRDTKLTCPNITLNPKVLGICGFNKKEQGCWEWQSRNKSHWVKVSTKAQIYQVEIFGFNEVQPIKKYNICLLSLLQDAVRQYCNTELPIDELALSEYVRTLR